MRHKKYRGKLGLRRSVRLAVVRNLTTQILQHEQIVTTLAKAKNVRSQVDNIITIAKRNDLSAKKKVISFLKNKVAVQKVFEEYLEIYKDRNSGFTRIYRLKNRLGDNAIRVLISMVDKDNIAREEGKKGEDTTLKQVKKDIEKTMPGQTKQLGAVDSSQAEVVEVKEENQETEASSKQAAGEKQKDQETEASSKQSAGEKQKDQETEANSKQAAGEKQKDQETEASSKQSAGEKQKDQETEANSKQSAGEKQNDQETEASSKQSAGEKQNDQETEASSKQSAGEKQNNQKTKASSKQDISEKKK